MLCRLIVRSEHRPGDRDALLDSLYALRRRTWQPPSILPPRDADPHAIPPRKRRLMA